MIMVDGYHQKIKAPKNGLQPISVSRADSPSVCCKRLSPVVRRTERGDYEQ